jgi:hypothetical protein
MSTRTREDTLQTLQLPDSFEDLSGFIRSDLKVIATALAERAQDRLLLPPRQAHRLRRTLLSKMTEIINETMESLTVERH